MEDAKYQYMARLDRPVPWLIRFGPNGAEAFNYPGVWEKRDHLNDIRYGHGAFMDYDDVTEEEAMEILKKNKEKFDQLSKKG